MARRNPSKKTIMLKTTYTDAPIIADALDSSTIENSCHKPK